MGAIASLASADPGPAQKADSAVPDPWFYLRSDDSQSRMRLGAEMLMRAQLDVVGGAA
jgi:hypothetical protein